jgi:uncharacterized protein
MGGVYLKQAGEIIPDAIVPEAVTAPRSAPLEVHVFSHQGAYYLFDVRNFTILKLGPEAAAVASGMSSSSPHEIAAELGSLIPAESVRRIYARFMELVDCGVLSSKPVPSPPKPPFHRLVLMLAGGCNMGCSYCFERDVPIYQDPNLLSRETADRVLNWFFACHAGPRAHLQLYGGEPLLNWPVLCYVIECMESWAQSKAIEFTKYLITNGTLLNPERIAYLKAHEVTIQVSADGSPETHDRFRVLKSGRGTVKTIASNVEELSRQGASYNLRAVLTRQNKDPRDVIEGLRSWGAKRVSFEVVATDCADAKMTTDDWGTFNQGYAAYVESPYQDWGQLPQDVQKTIIRICEGTKLFYGCGAGITEVTVSPDGSIYECQRIYREPFSHIDDARSPADLASGFLTMVDDRPVCRDCWARYLCGGGCLHQSHTGHGCDLPLPQYCEMKRKMVEASIVKIHQIRSANHVSREDRESGVRP